MKFEIFRKRGGYAIVASEGDCANAQSPVYRSEEEALRALSEGLQWLESHCGCCMFGGTHRRVEG